MTIEGTRGARSQLYRTALVLLALAVAGQFVWRGFVAPLRQALADPDSHYDFRPRYLAAVDLLHGANPYVPAADLPSNAVAERYGVKPLVEAYAPIVLVLYAPLTGLDFPLAKAVWLALNAGLVVVSIPLLRRVAGLPPSLEAWAAVTIVVMAFEPIVRGLSIGQANQPILILLCLSSLALARGRDAAAGAWVALAAIYKPLPALIFCGFILRRRWRVVAGGAVALLVAGVLSVACFGWSMHASYVAAVVGMGSKWTFWFANQSLAGFVARALVNNELGTSWTHAPLLARLLWVSASLTVVAVAGVLTRRCPAAAPTWTLSLWLVVGLLISPRAWDHHVVWVLVPFVIVAAPMLRQRPRPAMLALLVATYGLLAYPGMYWAWYPAVHRGALLPITSSQTFGLLLLFALLVRLHLTPCGDRKPLHAAGYAAPPA